MRYFLLACLLVAGRAEACMWDDDTLADEKRGLPGMAAILADKYERHSAFYYEKRIERARADIAAMPRDAGAHDNLAVALDRLGKYEEARDAALAKDKILPGEYTTHANLGTIYYHLGKLEESVRHIQQALKINPKAHFGREEYQLKIVQQMLAGKTDELLGAPMTKLHYGRKLADWTKLTGFKSDPIEAITGMIRFSDPRSPDLWYLLGWLLSMRGDKHFSSRAFQRALDAGHPKEKEIKDCIHSASSMMTVHGDMGADVIARERAEGKAWVLAYQEFEDEALRRGRWLESEADYAPFYRKWGHRDHESPWRWVWAFIRKWMSRAEGWITVASLGIVAILFRRWMNAPRSFD